jgi:hypothetical protein
MSRCSLRIASALLAFLMPVFMQGAQTGGKVLFVTPSAEAAKTSEQQLILRGLKAPASIVGVRVFLNPTEGATLTSESPSYLGCVYFSHRKGDEKDGQTFILSLRTPVSGKARLVLHPITSDGAMRDAKIELQDASIKPIDNSAFR